jgi:hypothetical protein
LGHERRWVSVLSFITAVGKEKAKDASGDEEQEIRHSSVEGALFSTPRQLGEVPFVDLSGDMLKCEPGDTHMS